MFTPRLNWALPVVLVAVLQEAEHAAAHAAVEFLTAERVLRPDLPTGSQGSKGGSAAAASPSVSSATSGITPPGVGSKRSKSNTDDEEATGDGLHG
jgi:hypothetical protein